MSLRSHYLITLLRRWIAGSLLLGMLAGVPTVWAHHSGANFDRNQQYLFRGTVTQFLWANPHAWVYLNVAKANGRTEFWGFELQGGTNMLRRAGWKATDLKPGDKVTIQAARDRTGARIASMEKVVTADGRTLTAWPSGGLAPSGVGMPKLPAAIEYK
jgi:hypothetical protein